MNDAFGSAHRAHASTVGIVCHLPVAAAGLLMEKELEWLGRVTGNPERPCIALLGGAKVSDKIDVIHNLMAIVDKVLIGGAMAYTFLRAKGVRTGRSLVEEDKIDLARELLSSAGSKLMLPVDHVVVREVNAGADHEIVKTLGEEQVGVDIGPETIEEYSKIIGEARTIILEWADGHIRDASLRQRNKGGASKARRRIRCGICRWRR